MKKISKRVLKVLLTTLALTMLLCIPASAASKKTVATIGKKSYTSLSSAVKAVKNGQTIKLKSDTTIKSAISRNKKYTIDLNGHTLKGTYNVKDSRISGVNNSVRITAGNVTIKNGAVTGLYVKNGVTLTLSKIVEPKYFETGYIYIKKGATVKIKSGTITRGIFNYGNLTISNGTFKDTPYGLTNESSGTVKIKGGTFKNVGIGNSGKMTISGGKFTNNLYSTLISNSGGKSQLTIKGGTFSSKYYAVIYNLATLKMTGGTVKYTDKTEDSNNLTLAAIVCESGSKTSITGGKISSKYSHGVYVSRYANSFKCSGAKITVSSSKKQKICDKR